MKPAQNGNNIFAAAQGEVRGGAVGFLIGVEGEGEIGKLVIKGVGKGVGEQNCGRADAAVFFIKRLAGFATAVVLVILLTYVYMF